MFKTDYLAFFATFSQFMALDDPDTCAYRGKGGDNIPCPIHEMASFCIKGKDYLMCA